MNEKAAAALMNAELKQLRRLPYAELVSMIGKEPLTFEAIGEDGNTYQLEVEVWWDSKKGQDVRVTVAIDDGGISAFAPLTDAFIKRPDGTFVGQFFAG
jgi:hypothetical protein